MKKIILSMISPLLIGVLLLSGKSVFALDRINVTLPSKSFQFIIFPLAKERGYMKEEGIDLNIVDHGIHPRPSSRARRRNGFHRFRQQRPGRRHSRQCAAQNRLGRHRSGAAVADGPAPVRLF